MAILIHPKFISHGLGASGVEHYMGDYIAPLRPIDLWQTNPNFKRKNGYQTRTPHFVEGRYVNLPRNIFDRENQDHLDSLVN